MTLPKASSVKQMKGNTMNPQITKSNRHHHHHGCAVCTIIPIHILVGMSRQREDESLRRRALDTMLLSERLRGRRDAFALLGAVALINPTGTKRRTIYD